MFSRRKLWLIGIVVLGIIILLTVFVAPNKSTTSSGSTYSRNPSGYGAWYSFMENKGVDIERWQKPTSRLFELDSNIPATLLQINSAIQSQPYLDNVAPWLEKGNTLIVLGIEQSATKAKFRTWHKTPSGSIKIVTSRRNLNRENQILGDDFGAIIWEKQLQSGRIIFVTTPHLAANAYQDIEGNYELLAQLATEGSKKLFVDEYMHGYKDEEVIEEEAGGNVFSYLSKTPLRVAAIQTIIMLLIAIWSHNRRFGQPVTIETPKVNNSEAYINALAGVLQKAGSTEFILEVVGKEEQLQLQKSLLLGTTPLEKEALIQGWKQQKGSSTQELKDVLNWQKKKSRIKEADLLLWLDKWAKIRSQ